MLNLKSLNQAENFVNRQKEIGNDVRWENYDIVFFRASERGVTSKDGVFRNGVWGYSNRFEVNESGEWNIDPRNVRRGKTTWR